MEQYILKSVLSAKINALLDDEFQCNSYEEATGFQHALQIIEDFIDTFEVKEVDLDFQTFAKEMETVFALPSSKTKNTEEEPLNWEYIIAKHFFNLSMAKKAQKGEEV